jgi:hypothetical protein
MKHLVFLAALAGATPAFAQGMEGIWFGGLAGGPREWDHQPAQITLQPVIIDDLIKVTMKAEGWKGFQFSNCTYFGRLDESGKSDLIFTKPTATNQPCPMSLPVTATPVDRDSIDFSISPGVIEGFPTTPVRLKVVLRDLVDDEMAVLPDGINVLGVAPGMSLAEAQTVLLGRGFTRFEKGDQIFETRDLVGQWVVFGKDPDPTRPGVFGDRIILSMTMVDKGTGDPTTASVIAIERNVWPDPSDALQIGTLEHALAMKFGTADDRAYFNRAGQRADRKTWCSETTMQSVPMHVSFEQGGPFAPICGTSVSVGTETDPKTGRAQWYAVRITYMPLVTRDYWKQIRRDEFRSMTEFVEVQEGADGAVPDL